MSRALFEVTDTNFEEHVRQSPIPVLLDFGADWCPPCKMIDPLVDEIAQKYAGKLRVGKVDGDAQPDLVIQFQVMGLPTLILLQAGEEVERLVGFMPRARIESRILPYLPEANRASNAAD